MQIKIEIDVKPEELRRFLGLPDVAGLQDDIVQFLREKVGQVNENLNPGDFVKGNLDLLRQSPTLQKLLTRIKINTSADDAADESRKPARKRTTRRSKPE